MIELIILKHLSNNLDVPVGLEKPEPLITSYVTFEKTGSSKRNHLLSSTLAFQSVASSMFAAATLNERVKESIESLIKHDEIVSVSLNGDYNFTDTTTKEYRYQAVFDIKHY